MNFQAVEEKEYANFGKIKLPAKLLQKSDLYLRHKVKEKAAIFQFQKL